MLTALQIDTLKVLRSGFRADIQDSEKALSRAKCKDPEWHRLRIRVRGEDVDALTAAIAMAEGAA